MPATTSKSRTESKPYDRPAKGKGKDKAPVGTGAPAQLKQSSRKGKKAWRKNVDISAEEQALEAARAEERLTGGKVESRSNDALFTIDTEGDVEMGKRLKRTKKPLRSLAILDERSAIPSLTSRTSKPKVLKTPKISGREKARLRKTALKAEANGTASIKATDVSSLRDAWEAEEAAQTLPGGYGDEAIVKRAIKTPETLERQRELRRAVDAAQLDAELPRAGISYNPSAPAHAALIEAAVAEEMGKLAAEERVDAEIAARGGVVEARRGVDDFGDDVVGGMRIGRGDGDDDEDSDDEDGEGGFKPKQTKRKTQAQRNKAARAKAALLAEREEANRRRIERHVGAARSMSKSVAAKERQAEEDARQRKMAAKARERAGFAGGEKIGKHRVQKSSVAVQLGDDLAESLRQVKPEGNLFKDRFQSLQRRALIEPRVPQLPKKRVIKVKEYEKFAWKRFE